MKQLSSLQIYPEGRTYSFQPLLNMTKVTLLKVVAKAKVRSNDEPENDVPESLSIEAYSSLRYLVLCIHMSRANLIPM